MRLEAIVIPLDDVLSLPGNPKLHDVATIGDSYDRLGLDGTGDTPRLADG